MLLHLQQYRLHCESYFRIRWFNAWSSSTSSREYGTWMHFVLFLSYTNDEVGGVKEARRHRLLYGTIECVKNFCQVYFNLWQMLILTWRTAALLLVVGRRVRQLGKCLFLTSIHPQLPQLEHPLWRFVSSQIVIKDPHYSLWWPQSTSHLSMEHIQSEHVIRVALSHNAFDRAVKKAWIVGRCSEISI